MPLDNMPPDNLHTETHLAERSAVQSTVQTEVYVDGSAVDAVPGVAIAQYQTWLQTWLTALDPQKSPINAYEVSLRLTDDAEIQQLNSDYRQQAKPTDVLSFAALETTLPGAEALKQEQPLCLGDIIISVETAARQAKNADHSLPTELAWLTAHGLLHLLGWDHPDDDSLAAMLNKQTELLALVTLP
ncbi:MAG: rRNA maturation RNase YbeY [Cyanobacteria bacterium J06554_3]